MRTWLRPFIVLLVLIGFVVIFLFAGRYQADSVRSQTNAALQTRLLRYCIQTRMEQGLDTAVCERDWWLPEDIPIVRQCDRTSALDSDFRTCLETEGVAP